MTSREEEDIDHRQRQTWIGAWIEEWLAEERAQRVGRTVIDQAVGIVMASGGRTPVQAFEILLQASTGEDRTLGDVATEIVQLTQERRPQPR